MSDPLKRLLVVEDEAIIALAEMRTLRAEGYEVLHASSGEEAVDLVRRDPASIDLILMDIDLGSGMDGTEAAEEIVRERNLPVVFLSSHGEPALVERTEKITNYGYILKNAGSTVLLASIKMAFRLHAANRELVAGREALRRSEEQYRSLVENLDVGILIVDLEDLFIYANPAAHAIFRTRGETLAGRHLGQFLDSENERIVARQTELRKRGVRSEYDFEIICGDGERRKVVVVATPRWDDGGEVVGTLAIIRDITDIRASDEALRRSESQYRELVANLSEGICIVDEQDRFIIANPAAHGIFGVEEGGLVGARLDSFLDEENRAIVARENEIRRSGERSEYRMDILARDGQTKRISVVASPRLDEEGAFIGTFAILRDLSELEKMESERRDLEAHYEFIFDNASAALLEEDFSLVRRRLDDLRAAGVDDLSSYFASNPQELANCAKLVKILDANKEYLELIGCDSKTTVVSTLLPSLGSYNAASFAAELSHLYSGNLSYEDEKEIRLPSGQVKRAKMRLAIAPNHAADWSRVIISFMDISEEKRIQADLSRSLEQKNILMRELEHRIKNNLNIISSLLNLEAQRLSDPRSRQTFSDMESRIRSVSLIYELLSHTASMNALDCRPYVEELLALTRETYGLDRLGLSIVSEVAEFELDTKRAVNVGLILNELLINAIKYAFPSSTKGEIRVGVDLLDGSVRLAVEDNGVGVVPGFDWRSGESLGLHLVDMLARQMGGSMKTHFGHGVRVEVRFPFADERR